MVVKQKSLSEIIADEIRHRIWIGKISFGERLFETDLAKEFEVSRSSLREAFQVLEFEGLVINKSRKGTFVTTFSEDDMREISEVRFILETKAFLQAVERMEEIHYKHLEDMTEEIKANIQNKNWDTAFDLDMDFHLYVVSLCDNSRIIKLYDVIQVQIRTFLSRLNTFYEKNPELLYSEHMELINALRSKDLTNVETTVKKHIYEACESIVELYKSMKI